MNSLQLGEEMLNFRESWLDVGFSAQIAKEFLIRSGYTYNFILYKIFLMHIPSILDHALRILPKGLEKDLKGQSTKFNAEL
jgi:hypothetical protein